MQTTLVVAKNKQQNTLAMVCKFGAITRALEWTMVYSGENTPCSDRSLVQSQSTSAMVCSGVTLRPVIHWEEGRGHLPECHTLFPPQLSDIIINIRAMSVFRQTLYLNQSYFTVS